MQTLKDYLRTSTSAIGSAKSRCSYAAIVGFCLHQVSLDLKFMQTASDWLQLWDEEYTENSELFRKNPVKLPLFDRIFAEDKLEKKLTFEGDLNI